jgi:hypothetical protein
MGKTEWTPIRNETRAGRESAFWCQGVNGGIAQNRTTFKVEVKRIRARESRRARRLHPTAHYLPLLDDHNAFRISRRKDLADPARRRILQINTADVPEHDYIRLSRLGFERRQSFVFDRVLGLLVEVRCNGDVLGRFRLRRRIGLLELGDPVDEDLLGGSAQRQWMAVPDDYIYSTQYSVEARENERCPPAS